MKKILLLLALGFISDSGKTPEFLSFAKEFKKAIEQELQSVGAILTHYNIGHFFISGFFRKDGNCFYFNLSDVRDGAHTKMYYRTAKDEKDYTGGQNRWITIEPGMGKKFDLSGSKINEKQQTAEYLQV